MRGHVVGAFGRMPVEPVVLRNDPSKERIEVHEHVRIRILLDHERRRRMADEQRQKAVADLAFRDPGRNLVRDVDQSRFPGRDLDRGECLTHGHRR